MSRKVVENSTKLEVPEMQAGASFRNYLENTFPPQGREYRSQWFFRLSRQTGIEAKRLEKLSYDEKCAIRAHEIIKLQRATSARISHIRNNLEEIKKHQRGTEHEAYQEIQSLFREMLDVIHSVGQDLS